MRSILCLVFLLVVGCGGGGGGTGAGPGGSLAGIWTLSETELASDCGDPPRPLLDLVAQVLVEEDQVRVISEVGTFVGTITPTGFVLDGAYREIDGWTHFTMKATVGQGRLSADVGWTFGQDPEGVAVECSGTSTLDGTRRTTPFVPLLVFMVWGRNNPLYPAQGSDLFVVATDGTVLPLGGERIDGRVLDFDPRSAPGGKWIACRAQNGLPPDLFLYPITGGVPIAIPSVATVAFSPDGSRLAYTQSTGPPDFQGHLPLEWWTSAADGSDPIRISVPEARPSWYRDHVLWSPDSQWLALDAMAVRVVNGQGVDERTVCTARWDGSEARRIHVPESSEQVNFFEWAPDGSRLAFATAVIPSIIGTPPTPVALHTCLPDGSGAVRVSSTMAWAGDFQGMGGWSPDGVFLSYTAEGDGDGMVDAFVVPAVGGVPKKIASPPPGRAMVAGAWSADGAWVQCYLEGGGATPGLAVAAPDGSGASEIYADGVRSYTWSPVGARLAVVSEAPPGEYHATSWAPGVALPTDLDTFLTRPLHVDWIGWSPAGDRIAFGGTEGGGASEFVSHVASLGGSPQVLTAELRPRLVTWPPPGDTLYFVGSPSDGTPPGVYAASAAGGPPVRLFDVPTGVYVLWKP